jgi:hypothetical protein
MNGSETFIGYRVYHLAPPRSNLFHDLHYVRRCGCLSLYRSGRKSRRQPRVSKGKSAAALPNDRGRPHPRRRATAASGTAGAAVADQQRRSRRVPPPGRRAERPRLARGRGSRCRLGCPHQVESHHVVVLGGCRWRQHLPIVFRRRSAALSHALLRTQFARECPALPPCRAHLTAEQPPRALTAVGRRVALGRGARLARQWPAHAATVPRAPRRQSTAAAGTLRLLPASAAAASLPGIPPTGSLRRTTEPGSGSGTASQGCDPSVDTEKRAISCFSSPSSVWKRLSRSLWQQSENVVFEQSRNVVLTAPSFGDAGRTTTDDAGR